MSFECTVGLIAVHECIGNMIQQWKERNCSIQYVCSLIWKLILETLLVKSKFKRSKMQDTENKESKARMGLAILGKRSHSKMRLGREIILQCRGRIKDWDWLGKSYVGVRFGHCTVSYWKVCIAVNTDSYQTYGDSYGFVLICGPSHSHSY